MKQLLSLFFLLACGSILWAQDQDDPRRQFDFWIGTWDVYKMGTDTLVGKSEITSILTGNSIKEEYASTQSLYKGTSLNSFNPQNQKWSQYWVDNGGLTLELKGTFAEGKMILEDQMNQITWYQMENGHVRQTWVNKADGKVLFDGEYKARER